MTTYIDLGIITDPTSLAAEALAYLSNEIEGYEPSDGNLEVILIEAIAPMAAALSDASTEVPLAVFINYGTQLLNFPYKNGQKAHVVLTFEAQNNEGYKVPAGTWVNIGEHGFQTQTEAVIPPGSTTVEALASAQEVGTEYSAGR